MDIETILVATDFSREAEAAIGQSLKLARATGAELVLAHVGPMPETYDVDELAPSASSEYQRILKAQLEVDREKLEAICARVRNTYDRVSKIFTDGHPDEAICQLAIDRKADIIAVGTHGRTGFHRLALGSVAEHVVRDAPCHVLVARPDMLPSQSFDDILIASDFSEAAERAVELGFAVAADGCRVELFSAWELPAEVRGATPNGAIDRAMTDSARGRLKAIAEARGRPGIRIEIEVAEGDPASEIVRRLDVGNYSLAVTGSNGRRGWRRWLLGSVSERVVRLAPCSVLVAKPRRDS